MTDNKEKKLDKIMSRAKLDLKRNYTIYHNYKRLIEDLELDPKSFERAVRTLANILEV